MVDTEPDQKVGDPSAPQSSALAHPLLDLGVAERSELDGQKDAVAHRMLDSEEAERIKDPSVAHRMLDTEAAERISSCVLAHQTAVAHRSEAAEYINSPSAHRLLEGETAERVTSPALGHRLLDIESAKRSSAPVLTDQSSALAHRLLDLDVAERSELDGQKDAVAHRMLDSEGAERIKDPSVAHRMLDTEAAERISSRVLAHQTAVAHRTEAAEYMNGPPAPYLLECETAESALGHRMLDIESARRRSDPISPAANRSGLAGRLLDCEVATRTDLGCQEETSLRMLEIESARRRSDPISPAANRSGLAGRLLDSEVAKPIDLGCQDETSLRSHSAAGDRILYAEVAKRIRGPAPAKDIVSHGFFDVTEDEKLVGGTEIVVQRTDGAWEEDIVCSGFEGPDHTFWYVLRNGDHVRFDCIRVKRCRADGDIRLPTGWEYFFDNEQKQYFYYSRSFGVSRWYDPTIPPTKSPVREVLDDIERYGFSVTIHNKVPAVSDEACSKVMQGTRNKIVSELCVKDFGIPSTVIPDYAQHYRLYADPGHHMKGKGSASAGGEFLLGRFDVCAVLANADFDSMWKFNRNKDKKLFWILHAAALNIGENEKASDFKNYSVSDDRLNIEAYIGDMGRIFDNILAAAIDIGVDEVVWIPFGMGALLRNLSSLDNEFSASCDRSAKTMDMRHSLARRFFDAVLASDGNYQRCRPGKRRIVHVCVSYDDKDSEADFNAAAFLNTLREAAVEGRFRGSSTTIAVEVHADGFDIAQALADSGASQVALVSDTHRSLIGNHWFEYGTRSMLDENMHRRSWRLAAAAYLLNGGTSQSDRKPGELQSTVKRLGGEVQTLFPGSGCDMKSKILAIFSEWDKNKDGYIGPDELTSVLLAIGVTVEDIEIHVQQADTNKDGRISYREFVNWIYGSRRPRAVRQ